MAYRLVLHDALPCILQRQYDGLVEIHEAIAAVRSKQFHATRPENREKIIALLDDRRRSKEIRRLKKRSRTTQPLCDQPADLSEVRDLMRLHEIAVWLLDDYSRNISCPFWMDQAKWSAEVLPLKFSRIEKKRYFRAFYRLQTFCNLFGQGESPVDGPRCIEDVYWNEQPIDEEDIWKLVFGTFAPWEYEEFSGLWQHFYDRNGELYREIANDLENYGPNNSGSLPEPLKATILPSCEILDTDDLRYGNREVRENLASFGPTFLYKFLQEEDFMTRRNVVYANARRGFSYFHKSLPRTMSFQLPLLYPADRFNFGFDLNGLQALLSTMPETERPNISWEKTWLENMDEDEPLYDEMFETGVRCRRLDWGYAFWDNERLFEWETKWGAPLRDFAY